LVFRVPLRGRGGQGRKWERRGVKDGREERERGKAFPHFFFYNLITV